MRSRADLTFSQEITDRQKPTGDSIYLADLVWTAVKYQERCINGRPQPRRLCTASMPLHTTGCFSWLRRKSTRKPPAAVGKPMVLATTGVSHVHPPAATEYAFEAGKQTLEILQRFSNMLPIPCANEALELALLLMTTYEVSGTRKCLEKSVANVIALGCHIDRAASKEFERSHSHLDARDGP